MPKKYLVEEKKKGKWTFAGLYPEKFIPQMVNRCINIASHGKKMYQDIRIGERTEDGKTTVL